tara:strand:- start:10928 stop:14500 length:3573 start_codon:yes stop_codon:yes gene_type:complete
MTKSILRVLGSGISITIFVTIGFSILIWFLGPLIGFGDNHPWDSSVSRLITIGLIFLFGLAVILIIVIRISRRDQKMADDIVENVEVDDDSELVKAELGELKDKLKSAMTILRKSKFGRKSLYELPWYVLIGPPGSGKTTAIVNSGLQFPLADSMGKTAIGGIGGTRNCDWWFTDNAVLIDTAGRYTTQDSSESEDNAGWLGFLQMLKKNRKRQPINGAIVTISLSDLSLQDEITQKSQAAAIRRRLLELREKLGVRFPVYVLFTKSDLIAGFTEFFDNLGKEDRGQVWGFTLPQTKNTKSEMLPMAVFNDEFSLLLQRLNALSLERMQQETNHQRRSLISNFPAQVASVQTTADIFLREVFQDNRFEQQQLLRGIYFTSGTQEGTPIDRLMMGMARTFGIGRQAIGTGQGAGRSFFLTRLLSNVVFSEAGLVSADDKVERRYRWSKRISIMVALIGGIGLGGLWARSFVANGDILAAASIKVEDYRKAASQIPGSPIADSDLPSVVPALNVLRDLPANSVRSYQRPAHSLTYGLYQGKVLGNQAAQTYISALNEHLLPRMLLRLEEQMLANMDNPEFLYEALKVYLMLGDQGPMDKELVREWMSFDWSIGFAGDTRAVLRKDLDGHLEVLLSRSIDDIALNGPLIEQIQGLLSEMPLAERVYNGIINSPSAKELAEWRLTDIGGPAVSRVIVRSSGKPLDEGVAGIFTYDGFNTVFLNEALGVAKRVQGESWVLGPRGISEQSEVALLALSRDVLDLYYNDYIAHYDKVLGDLDIIPMENLSHAVEVTNVLSGPTSPLVNILNAISEETKLTVDRSTFKTSILESGAKEIGIEELKSSSSGQNQIRLEALLNSTSSTGGLPPDEPGAYVEGRFVWLHELVTQFDGQPSPLDELIGSLIMVYQDLNKLSFSGIVPAEIGEASATLRFLDLATRMPDPIQRWATQIASGSSGITSEGTRESINARWQAQVLPFCKQALNDRYPFQRNAQSEVGLQDFARLFSPSGLIDTFFNENLIDYVDKRARPWAWKVANDTDLGISLSVLQQMQYAAEIRDAFFTEGSQPSVKFQLIPEALDEKAKTVTLEIDGQVIAFKHKQPLRPVAVAWPGDVGQAAVVFQPTLRNTGNELRRDGPWAWFRLLNAATIRATNVSDRTRIIFNVGGRLSIFQMQSGSVLNPFTLPALSAFNCPSSF